MRFVIYSHSSFSDLLEIQEMCFKNFDIEHFLIIDEPFDYKGNAKKVIRYKNSEPFAFRLFNSMKQIDDEHVLLIHDNDLLCSIDFDFIEKAVQTMREKKIDKIDLQHFPPQFLPPLQADSIFQLSNETTICKTSFPHDQYVYNVQPSIWRRESLIEALAHYRDQTYRSIEYSGIQQFCSSNFQMYRTVSSRPLPMGYYSSVKEFIFMHMTHYEMLTPVNPAINGMCEFGTDFYQKLIKFTNLTKHGRKFRNSMYGQESV